MTTETLTDEQKIAYLAEKIMGWKIIRYETEPRQMWIASGFAISVSEWNPLTDWNHWRQVEEKAMGKGNGPLWLDFVKSFRSISSYMDADLPTRVDALILAHSSINT